MSKRVWWVYLGGFLLAVHYASVAYVNSSLLKQFTTDSKISLLYVVGSVLSIAMLALAPFFLRKWGNIATLLFFIALEIFAVFGMGSSNLALLIFLSTHKNHLLTKPDPLQTNRPKLLYNLLAITLKMPVYFPLVILLH